MIVEGVRRWITVWLTGYVRRSDGASQDTCTPQHTPRGDRQTHHAEMEFKMKMAEKFAEDERLE